MGVFPRLISNLAVQSVVLRTGKPQSALVRMPRGFVAYKSGFTDAVTRSVRNEADVVRGVLAGRKNACCSPKRTVI